MKRVFVPTRGPDDWRPLLRDPERHWQDEHSAKELAIAWDQADGFPAEVQALFATSGEPALCSPKLLAAFPEWKTGLPGRGGASQTDILVVASAADALLVAAVEGKVGESLDDTVATWLKEAKPGEEQNRLDRLAFVQDVIGVRDVPACAIRYQLLHRAAAAVLEARRLHARYAAVIVHSLGETTDSLCDYQVFTALYGSAAPPEKLVKLREVDGIGLFAGWASGQFRDHGRCHESDHQVSPFLSYPGWLKHEPRCLGTGSSRTGYGLKLQQITRQTHCAYCRLDLSDTYEHWLLLTVDHVIPGYMARQDGWLAWVQNANNLVVCCSACNGFLNGFRMAPGAVLPKSFEEFEHQRELIFNQKKDLARGRHEHERRLFAARPWEEGIDPSALPTRP